jgi:hypothetical protein
MDVGIDFNSSRRTNGFSQCENRHGSDRVLHSILAAPLNYRTVSGSDRMLHSTALVKVNVRLGHTNIGNGVD